MNLKFGKSLTYIVHIVFTIAFIVHISIVVFSIFNPEIPDVETSEKHLKDIAFPFSFRLCVHKLVDTNKKYWDSGYYNYYAFYKGRSLYNKSLYGFSGHLTNGSTKFNTYEGFLDNMFFSTFKSCSFRVAREYFFCGWSEQCYNEGNNYFDNRAKEI